MSLDVYLKGPVVEVSCTCTRCWNEHTREEREEYFQGNITHNLNAMAAEAGVYDVCWRPEENGITKAEQLIEPLKKGLERLKAEPERFKALNPSNGWGDYDGLVEWLEAYLAACVENPNADVRASR